MTLLLAGSSVVFLILGIYGFYAYKKFRREKIDVEIAVLGHSGAGKTTGIVQLIDKLNNKKCKRIWGSFVEDKTELELRELDTFIADEPTHRHTYHMVDKFIREGTTPTLGPEDCFLNIHYKHVEEADVQDAKHLVRMYDVPGGDFEKFQQNNQRGLDLQKKIQNSCGVLLYIDGKNPPQNDHVQMYNAYTQAIERAAKGKSNFPVWLAITKTDLIAKNPSSAKEFLQKNAKRFAPILEFSSHIKPYARLQSKTPQSKHYDGDITGFRDFYQDVYLLMQKQKKKKTRKTYLSLFAGIVSVFACLILIAETFDHYRYHKLKLQFVADISPTAMDGSIQEIEGKIDRMRMFLKKSPRSAFGYGFFYKEKITSSFAQIATAIHERLQGNRITKKNILNNITPQANTSRDIITNIEKETDKEIRRRRNWLRILTKIQIHSHITVDQVQQMGKFLDVAENCWSEYKKLKGNDPVAYINVVYIFSTIAAEEHVVAHHLRFLIEYRCALALENVNTQAFNETFPQRLDPLNKWIRVAKDARGEQRFKQLLFDVIEKKAWYAQDEHWKTAIDTLQQEAENKISTKDKLDLILGFLRERDPLKGYRLHTDRDCIPLYVEKYILTRFVDYFVTLQEENSAKPLVMKDNKNEYLPWFHNLFLQSPYVRQRSTQSIQKLLSQLPPQKYIGCEVVMYFFSEYFRSKFHEIKNSEYQKVPQQLEIITAWISQILKDQLPEDTSFAYRFVDKYTWREEFVKIWSERSTQLKNITTPKEVSLKIVDCKFDNEGNHPVFSDGQCENEWNDETFERYYLYTRITLDKQLLIVEKDGVGTLKDWHPWLTVNYAWVDSDGDTDQEEIVDDDILQQQQVNFWQFTKVAEKTDEYVVTKTLKNKVKYVLQLQCSEWIVPWLLHYWSEE
ncbi:GTPase domain-containing protein [Candidatus Uabimicrobium amorphum]|uniref:Double-GTPase 2 domain-containing protein n=1 Tax=Uabimicrobium amorphum TaxID=2596890 RepID=A0A5S9IRU0_UABAM|nr:GTPase domain-containing protein [Candidatus Uabimicrobium amorphum]BBM86968.1 hypothetical protein UABAM_05370 [Candidatus Uabimicrobium amorphum]